MDKQINRLDIFNKVLIGLIIGAGCLAITLIALKFGQPENQPETTPAVSPPATKSTPTTTDGVPASPDRQPTEAEKVAALMRNPPKEFVNNKEEVKAHQLADLEQVVRWRYHLGDEFQGAPAIRPDGSIIVAGQAGTVFAINQGGKLLWSHTAAIAASRYADVAISPVAVDRDGGVYLSASRRLVALSTAGKQLWEYEHDTGWLTAPVAAPGGSLLVKNIYDSSSGLGDVLAVRPDGSLQWIYRAIRDDLPEYPMDRSALSIGKDGRIYDLGRDGSLVTFSRRGNRGWGLGMHSGARGPAIDSAGILHLVSQPDPDKNDLWLAVALIPQSGGAEEQWHFELPGGPVCDPVVGADDRAYFACQAGLAAVGQSDNVYAFNRGGEIDWQLELLGVKEILPPGAPDGVMCVRTESGTFVVSAAGDILFSLSESAGHPIPRVIGSDGVIYCEQAGSLVAIDSRRVPAE